MLLRDFLPSPALSETVRCIGIVHFSFHKGDVVPPKAFSPRPGESLYFFPKDAECVTYPGDIIKRKRPPVFIMGQHTQLIHRFVGQEFLAIIVHFQPGALYRLTGIPSSEFTDACIDAEAIFSREALFNNEQLHNASSYKNMIAIVESYLIKLFSQTKRDIHSIDVAAKMLLQKTEHLSMSWLAKETCLCPKQFERKFKERIGVKPSLLARIARFDKAFKMKNAHLEKDWLTIAVQCGYHDYEHLVRDYKAFTGLTPPSFFQLESQAPERIFDLHE